MIVILLLPFSIKLKQQAAFLTILMRVFHGAGEIDDREQKEHEPLDKRYENTQRHDGQWGKKSAGQSEKDRQNDFMSHHVSEKTERQGKYPGKVADDFNDKDQRRHPPYGA